MPKTDPVSDAYYMKLYKDRLKILQKASNRFHSQKIFNRKYEAIRKAMTELQKTYRKKRTDHGNAGIRL